MSEQQWDPQVFDRMEAIAAGIVVFRSIDWRRAARTTGLPISIKRMLGELPPEAWQEVEALVRLNDSYVDSLKYDPDLAHLVTADAR